MHFSRSIESFHSGAPMERQPEKQTPVQEPQWTQSSSRTERELEMGASLTLSEARYSRLSPRFFSSPCRIA